MTSAATPDDRPHREHIDVYGVSHTGRVRSENQDQFLIASVHKSMRVLQTTIPREPGEIRGPSYGYVLLVADGVGGIPGGQAASGTALNAVVEYVLGAMDLYVELDEGLESEFVGRLRRSVEHSHEAVLAASEGEQREGMATTLTMIYFRWPRAFIVHVGDCRLYRLRDGALELMTKDQTMAQAMVDAGALSPEQAAQSALRNILYSALGASRAEPMVVSTDHRWEDRMLLCTDGLTKHVSDEEIRTALATMVSAKETTNQLLQLALERGGTDNTTLIVGRLKRPQ